MVSGRIAQLVFACEKTSSDVGGRGEGRATRGSARWRRGRAAESGLVSRVLCVSSPTRGNHSSRTAVARRLQQPTRESNPTDRTGPPRPSPRFPLFGFAPGGVYRAGRVAPAAGALLPHRFTLTDRRDAKTPADGGLLSVALSLASRPVDVIDHPVLWSPDFPPARQRPKPPASRRLPRPLPASQRET